MKPIVIRSAWTDNPKHQIGLLKSGEYQLSHTDKLPLEINISKPGKLCRKVIATTTEDIYYRDAVCMITVPRCFVTDLSSIPRGCWFLVSPYDIALEGIVHDLLYRSQEVARDYADYLFYRLMKIRGVPWYVRFPVYYAVRLFGKKAWEHNKRRLERARKETQ